MEDIKNIELSDSDFNVEVRKNGTEIFNESYSEKAVKRLKDMVLNFYGQGERKFYQIYVDGESVVDRNSDGRKFDRYLQFVNESTRTVEVRLYKKNSFNCNRYIFILNKALSGMDTNQGVNMKDEINKALKAQELQNELIYLKAELEKKEKKIKKLKKLTAEKEDGISMGAVKEFLIEGKGLVDAFRGNANPAQLGEAPQQEPDSEVTIESAEEEPSEEQQIFKDLYAHVGESGIKKALSIMGILSQNPELEDLLITALKKKEEEKNGEA